MSPKEPPPSTSPTSAAGPSTTSDPKPPRSPKFPTHNAPRVWFLTAASSPIGISLARHLLAHGDYICAGVSPASFSTCSPHTASFRAFLSEISASPLYRSHFRVVALDVRVLGQCQSAIAEAVSTFGRVDILFVCSGVCAVGSVEEFAADGAARTVGREQFEVNFFGTVNAIKAVLPTFRAKRNGHLLVLTGITGHLGTPGLGLYCASQWAVEGYCDSLAYEVAPFNVRTTIVQPNVEVGVLTGKVVSARPMEQYGLEQNGAPLFRDILSGLLDRLEGGGVGEGRRGSMAEEEGGSEGGGPTTGDMLHQDRIAEVYPPLSKGLQERLVAETVHAVAAIGGHDNPPSRHIVGHEGVASVKEKLKTVSEELEDFVEVSAAVDIGKDDAPILAAM